MSTYSFIHTFSPASQSVIAIANEDMMGDGCYYSCYRHTHTHTVIIISVILSISAQEFHNSFRSYDDVDDDDAQRIVHGFFWPFICCHYTIKTMVHGIFSAIAIAIIRNVCIPRKICYGLLLHYITFKCAMV